MCKIRKGFEKRYLVEYVHATENEIAADITLLIFLRIKAEDFGYIPRPAIWHRYADKSKRIFHIFSLMLAPVWIYGGFFIFNIIQFLSGLWFFIRSRSRENSVGLLNQSYILTFSPRAPSVIIGSGATVARSNVWITVPWVAWHDPKLIDGDISCDVFQLLSASDLWRAFRLSLAATLCLRQRSSTKHWVLQSYTAFKWFLVRIALSKLNGSFVMAHDSDRWASLVDSVVWRSRLSRSECGGEHPRLVVVQHGALGSLDNKEVDSGYFNHLPYKLKSVTEMFVFDDESKLLYQRDIIEKRAYENCHFKYFMPSIVLSQEVEFSKYRILFVGHPICEHLHVLLYKSLKSNGNIQFFYKPHPTASASDLIKMQEWTIVYDKTCFPNVDLLISYPSTLVREYKAVGVEALIHPIATNVDETNVLIDRLNFLCKGYK